MPIYAYKCASCGHADDVLQKLADAPLTVCPKCGKESYSKQITAPQFQLKGSGWYVTDFRGGSSTAAAWKGEDKPADTKVESKSDSKGETKPAATSETKSDSKSDSAPVASTAKPSTNAPAT
jgi:putative FmdB family regulatory protein